MSAYQIGFLASRVLSILVMIRIISSVPLVVSSMMFAQVPAQYRSRFDFAMPAALILSMALLLVLCWLLWAKADWIGALLSGVPEGERVLVRTPPLDYLIALGVMLLAAYYLVQALPDSMSSLYEYVATRRSEPYADVRPFVRHFLVSGGQLAIAGALFYWSWQRISRILDTQPREQVVE
jgi:hypothetical protein